MNLKTTTTTTSDEGNDDDISEMEELTTSGSGALPVDLSDKTSTEKSTQETEREHRLKTWQVSKASIGTQCDTEA